jgi:translation initiation factor 4E transporter
MYVLAASDPKERLKEEQDGIVLSPQRRNFSTGCQVSKTSSSLVGAGGPSIYRQSSLTDYKDREERDRSVTGGGFARTSTAAGNG